MLENGYKIKVRPPRCLPASLLTCLPACPLPTSRLPACPTVISVSTLGVVWLLLNVHVHLSGLPHMLAATQRACPSEVSPCCPGCACCAGGGRGPQRARRGHARGRGLHRSHHEGSPPAVARSSSQPAAGGPWKPTITGAPPQKLGRPAGRHDRCRMQRTAIGLRAGSLSTRCLLARSCS